MHLCMTLIFILYCSCFKKANWYFCILLTFPMPCVGLYKWVTKRWVLSNCNRWKGCCHDICWQKDHQKYASFYRGQVGNIRLWELFQNHSSENRICLQFINLIFCQQYQVMFPTFLIFGNTLVLNKKYCLVGIFLMKKQWMEWISSFCLDKECIFDVVWCDIESCQKFNITTAFSNIQVTSENIALFV